MEYRDKAEVYVYEAREDGMGGFIEEFVLFNEIKCKVAPYTVDEKLDVHIPVPYSLVKFFIKSDVAIPDMTLSEDDVFYLKYNGKIYKKIKYIDYGKCKMIIGERYIEH